MKEANAKSAGRILAEKYWNAECKHDLKGVLDCYHDDAVFCPPGKKLKGHEEIQTFYDEAFSRFVGLKVEITNEISNTEATCLEWSATLIDKHGGEFLLSGANIFKFKEGKYTHLNTYFDPTLLMK